MMSLDHCVTLSWGESSEGEHSDLICHMGPGSLSSDSLKSCSQQFPHFSDSIGHINQLVEPLLPHGWLVQDNGGDSCSMFWWRGVVLSDDDLNLGKHFCSSGLISTDEVQSTASLTVEAHDFGKRLSDDHLKASVKEVTQTNTVLVEVTGDKALISSVEEGIEAVLFANAGDFFPLSESRVDAGGVVGASVQEDGRAGSGVLQVRNHAIEVEALGLLVEVAVVANLQASSGEDGVVVAPGGGANIDGRRSVLH